MADSPAQLVELSAQALNAHRWAQAGALAQSARTLAEQSNDAPLAERAMGFEELSRIAPGLNASYVMLMSLQLRGEFRGETLKELVRKDPGGATVLEARLNDTPTLKKRFGIELSTEHQETARSGGTSLAAAGGGGLVMFIIIARILLRMSTTVSRSSPDNYGYDIDAADQRAAFEQALQQQKYPYHLPPPPKAVAPQVTTLWHFPKKQQVPDSWNVIDDLRLLDDHQLVIVELDGDPFELESSGKRFTRLESVRLAPTEAVSAAIYALPPDAKSIKACRDEACTGELPFAKADAVVGFPPNAKRRALGTVELGKSDGNELIALMVEEKSPPPDFGSVPWLAIKEGKQLVPTAVTPFFLEDKELVDGAEEKPRATRIVFGIFELEPGDERPKQVFINGQVIDLPAKPKLALSEDLKMQLAARGNRTR
jgi:hypothetical protein